MSAVPVVHLVEDGHLAFRCPGCKGPHVLDVRSRWQWNGDSIKPTLSPSVLVRSGHHVPGHRPGVDNCWCTYQKEHPEDPVPFSCAVCHSFVRSGEVEFLGDSTHALAGQTVPLPPWEEAT